MFIPRGTRGKAAKVTHYAAVEQYKREKPNKDIPSLDDTKEAYDRIKRKGKGRASEKKGSASR